MAFGGNDFTLLATIPGGLSTAGGKGKLENASIPVTSGSVPEVSLWGLFQQASINNGLVKLPPSSFLVNPIALMGG